MSTHQRARRGLTHRIVAWRLAAVVAALGWGVVTAPPALAVPAPVGGVATPTLPPPANDRLEDAAKLGSAAELDLADQTNVDATAETFGVFDCASTHRTVWYRWTAPANGVVQLRALKHQDGGDQTLAAFAGRPLSLTGWSRVGCNNDTDGTLTDASPLNPSVTFGVSRGTTYYVAVGADTEAGAGVFDLRLRFVRVTIEAGSAAEGAAGSTSLVPVTIRLSSSALNPQAVNQFGGRVDVTVADTGTGTASPGVDYQPIQEHTFAFGPGTTELTGNVAVIGNDTPQPDRTVLLAAVGGAVHRSSVGVPVAGPPIPFDPQLTRALTIEDDD
jgi:hypothetical protein